MTAPMRATPRKYKNVEFRSTLEADWAYNLDLLGIVWQYEPIAVRLVSGEDYRPDFYLPELSTWLEVKGPHNERIGKPYDLGRAVQHHPGCDGIVREKAFSLLVPTAQLPTVEQAITSANDGPTQLTVQTFDEARGRLGQTYKPRRRIELDAATRSALNGADIIGRIPWLGCCTKNEVPYQLVVIGRAPREGLFDFESPQSGEITIIKCSLCHHSSFFQFDAGWLCRRCGEKGRVFRGGSRKPRSAPINNPGDGWMPFKQLPRRGK